MKIGFEHFFPATLLAVWASVFAAAMPSLADEPPPSRGDWQGKTDESTGIHTSTMELLLTPAAEAKPALKYRFIPDEYERRGGNAALYYLKALGFLEQTNARTRLTELEKAARENAAKGETPVSQFPPYSYLTMHPDDYPIKEVKEYLHLLSFQNFFLKEASMCKNFNLDRNIREFDSPVSYLLPEIQAMRDLARTQSVRTRLAIAEGQVEKAIQIIGQQFTLSNHLGKDEFLVSNLVGVACSSIGMTDLCLLLERTDTPNLYWALATLPSPLIEMTNSLPMERQFLFLQLKPLAHVDEVPKPAQYWSETIDQAMPQIRDLFYESNLPQDPLEAKMWVATQIAVAYPSARQYLIQQVGMKEADVAKLCVTQTVLLGYRRCYEELRDEQFKLFALPPHQSTSQSKVTDVGAEYGWVAVPANMMLPSVQSIRRAQTRQQQMTALLQTVESIRHYGAEHAATLPENLSDLSLPAPLDPITNSPLVYSVTGNRASLSSHVNGNFQYRLTLQFRK